MLTGRANFEIAPLIFRMKNVLLCLVRCPPPPPPMYIDFTCVLNVPGFPQQQVQAIGEATVYSVKPKRPSSILRYNYCKVPVTDMSS